MSDILKKLKAILDAKDLLKSQGVDDDVISLRYGDTEALNDFYNNEKNYETICKWILMYEKESDKEKTASMYMNMIGQITKNKFRGCTDEDKINMLAAKKTPFFGNNGWGNITKITDYEVGFHVKYGKCLKTCMGQGMYEWYPYKDYGKTWGFHLGEIDDDEVKK